MLHWKTGSRKGQIYKDDVLPVIQITGNKASGGHNQKGKGPSQIPV